jgi:hypothetical protein
MKGTFYFLFHDFNELFIVSKSFPTFTNLTSMSNKGSNQKLAYLDKYQKLREMDC